LVLRVSYRASMNRLCLWFDRLNVFRFRPGTVIVGAAQVWLHDVLGLGRRWDGDENRQPKYIFHH